MNSQKWAGYQDHVGMYDIIVALLLAVLFSESLASGAAYWQLAVLFVTHTVIVYDDWHTTHRQFADAPAQYAPTWQFLGYNILNMFSLIVVTFVLCEIVRGDLGALPRAVRWYVLSLNVPLACHLGGLLLRALYLRATPKDKNTEYFRKAKTVLSDVVAAALYLSGYYLLSRVAFMDSWWSLLLPLGLYAVRRGFDILLWRTE